jgi:hypothetical protein
MSLLRALVLLGAAFAAGCTPMRWVKPDVTAQQLNQDAAQCHQQAWHEARWRSFLYRPIGPTLYHDRYGRRFAGWPYSPFGDPFGDEFMEQSRLAHFCMRAKGYELAPAEREPADRIQPSPGGTSKGKP